MKLQQLFKLVIINIYHNKMRTFLTTLGVIVGTATIFLVVAIGKGGEAQVNEQYSRLNVGTIVVMPASRGRVVDPLTKEDAIAFAQSENVAAAFPILQGSGDIKYSNYSDSASYMGITPDYLEANNLSINAGRLLSSEDENGKERTAVVGYELANTLTDGNPTEIVGKTIDLNRRKFEIVGLLSRYGDSGGRGSFDDSAFIPYSSAERYLFGTRANPVINVQATTVNTVEAAMQDITVSLNANHRLGGAEQFRMFDAGSRLVAAQETARTMSLLLLSVAVVVLIVSGIGIMNVMFVTVKERTKEIGTLKAIGAKKKEILGQFLSEAVVISLVGGIIGVIIGFTIIPIINYFDLAALPTVNGVILGLLFSAVTGIFFGFYPAWQAADLNPIDALRYE